MMKIFSNQWLNIVFNPLRGNKLFIFTTWLMFCEVILYGSIILYSYTYLLDIDETSPIQIYTIIDEYHACCNIICYSFSDECSSFNLQTCGY